MANRVNLKFELTAAYKLPASDTVLYFFKAFS